MKASEKKEEKFFYKSDDFISYEVSGDGGIPLVLIHGFGSSRRNWDDLVERLDTLSPSPYTIYALDCKGSGKSSKPRNSDYSINGQAKIIVEFIRKKKLHGHVLAGHSLGGGIALLATLLLDKFADAPKQGGLILLDTACYPTRIPGFIEILRSPLTRWIPLYFVSSEKKARRSLETVFFDQSKVTPEIVERYASLWRMKGYKRAVVATAERIVPKNADELTSRFPTIEHPALVVWGGEDRVLRLELAERLVEDLPNAELAVVEASGHCPMEERPDETARLFAGFAERVVARLGKSNPVGFGNA